MRRLLLRAAAVYGRCSMVVIVVVVTCIRSQAVVVVGVCGGIRPRLWLATAIDLKRPESWWARLTISCFVSGAAAVSKSSHSLMRGVSAFTDLGALGRFFVPWESARDLKNPHHRKLRAPPPRLSWFLQQ